MKTVWAHSSAHFPALLSAACWLALAAGICGAIPCAPARASADGVEVRAVSASKEQYERDVDAVALGSQQEAITKLSNLLRKYRNTSQEPVLLERLADLQQQAAAIQFRLTYGRATKKGGKVDTGRFNRTMESAIRTLSRLIGKYPGYADISHAYFMRGKGYEEIDDKKAAAKDYLYLVNRFPGADDAIPAYMSLAEFSIAANDYPRAIPYLKEVEKHPDDPHYPFALYKLAWAFYNLKDIPTALHYAETQVRYYNDLDKQDPGADHPTDPGSPLEVTSDNALRENTLLDSTVFYFEGYEENPSKYAVQDAFDYFRGLESGPILGKMYLRYSKLLRSHAHDADLVAWMNLALKDELGGRHHYDKTLDIVLNTYEHVRDRRDWPELTRVANDIVSLYDEAKSAKFAMYDSMPKAQQMLLDTAQSMQAAIVKNRASDEARTLSGTLASIYYAFVKVVDDTDPRIPGVHYNLAETLFAVQDYEGATTQYRWVVDHGNWRESRRKSALKDHVTVAQASLKAIASRYEVLEKTGLMPKSVSAVALAKSSDAALPVPLKEWIGWIDELRFHLRDDSHSGVPGQDVDNFGFEADRALYSHGHVAEAVRRLTDFAEDEPSSKFAIPAASLVIDTYIATGDWNLLLQKSEELREVDEWKNTDFGKRLFAVSAQASYKLVEAKARQKDYAGTLSGVDRFLKTYAKSDLLGDALTLAGTAAMESHRDELAMKYFSRLIREAPSSKSLKDALLARARIEESRYSLGGAASDYRAYLKVNGKPDVDLQKKILELIWIDGDRKSLKDALGSKDLCNASTSDECERYLALGALEKPDLFGIGLDEAFRRARKENGELGGLWAIVSLQGARRLAFRDRLLAVRHAASHWNDFDPLVKLAVLPYLNESIPQALAMNRKMMDEVAPLRAPSAESEERYIAHRVDVMREMENAVTLAMKLPWARIKAGAMNELAGTYIDFSRSLSALQPKGLKPGELAIYQDTVRKITIPFDEKGEDLREKAFEMASDYAIEGPALHAISDPFFADNPSQARKYRKLASPSAVAAGTDLDLSFMDIVDNSTGWKKIEAEPDSADNPTAREFVRSLDEHNWPKLAYLLQQARARAAFSQPVLSAMEAVSMASLGAQAEGLLELDRSRKLWAGKTRLFVLSTLSQYFERSYALQQAQSLQKEINAEQTPNAGKPSG